MSHDIEPCIYCGLPATGIDHIPPRAMRHKLQDLGEYVGTWIEVPSCSWCNSTLNDLALLTITDRKLYIKQRIRAKYKRILSSVDWTDEQLEELGYSLKSKIKATMSKKKILKLRLDW